MKLKMFSFLWLVVLCWACGAQQEQPSAASKQMEQVLQLLEEGHMHEAEQTAFGAVLAGRDSVEEEEAMSLLCFVYIMEGKDDKAQVLMSTLPAQRTMSLIRLQEHAGQQRQASLRLWLLLAVVGLVAVVGVLAWWHRRRLHRLQRVYAERVGRVHDEIAALQLRLADEPQQQPLQWEQLHLGVDVLHRMVQGQNISQCGKTEQTAVVETLQLVDRPLAELLAQAESPLTPKETFFCILQHYGKTDAEKAQSFCCSEQAVRSTKSRLSRKLDLSTL